MTKSQEKDFDRFMSQLSPTNATLDYFVDFGKICRNVEELKMDLHALNYLLGRQSMATAVGDLWRHNPKALNPAVLEILIAVRPSQDKLVWVDERLRRLNDIFHSPAEVTEFLEKTGLGKFLQSGAVSNLVDYVFGVEAGLDSNARKNRGGDQMQRATAHCLDAAGLPYGQQVSSLSYPAIAEALGDDKKIFDFVFPLNGLTYLAEVNFYSTGGSKLNEVARSYIHLSQCVDSVPGFRFLWVTDGKGWEQARNKLEESYREIPLVFNLTTFPDFLNGH